MIAKLHLKPRQTYPSLSEAELRNESDVEQKFIYPFLTHASFLGIPSLWVRTKEYMTPTEIDKLAGKRSGYVPDYSIWYRGLPLLMVEAKGPDVVIERALREARLYAGEINKRYPPGANPIGFILACNGVQVALSQWDSEAETVIFNIEDVGPGSAALELFRTAVGHKALEQHANALASHFSTRRFFSAFSFMRPGCVCASTRCQ